MKLIPILLSLSLFLIPQSSIARGGNAYWSAKVTELCQEKGQESDECKHAQEILDWYPTVMQPQNPYLSCCGEADAFEADDFASNDKNLSPYSTPKFLTVIITDGKGQIKNGTEILVPYSRIQTQYGNPTGKGIIFLRSGDLYVYCYIPIDGN